MSQLLYLIWNARRNFISINWDFLWRNPKDYRGIIPRVINTEKDLQKKYIDKKVGNVIAISKYLYQHYLEQNCNAILLPPIFPEADKKKKLIRENSDNRKVLKIVYAGALASKDYSITCDNSTKY